MKRGDFITPIVNLTQSHNANETNGPKQNINANETNGREFIRSNLKVIMNSVARGKNDENETNTKNNDKWDVKNL